MNLEYLFHMPSNNVPENHSFYHSDNEDLYLWRNIICLKNSRRFYPFIRIPISDPVLNFHHCSNKMRLV